MVWHSIVIVDVGIIFHHHDKYVFSKGNGREGYCRSGDAFFRCRKLFFWKWDILRRNALEHISTIPDIYLSAGRWGGSNISEPQHFILQFLEEWSSDKTGFCVAHDGRTNWLENLWLPCFVFEKKTGKEANTSFTILNSLTVITR